MKKLKKILLINWLYFSKQLIELDDVNFLTGKMAQENPQSLTRYKLFCWVR